MRRGLSDHIPTGISDTYSRTDQCQATLAWRSPFLTGAICSILLFAAIIPSPAEAASFSCAKASSPDEKAICADDNLSGQDTRADAVYRMAVARYGRAVVNGAARQFLRERRKCRYDRSCISSVQQRMIAHYQDLMSSIPDDHSAVGTTVPYGSRAGMVTTIVSAYGIGTGKAIIETEHTRENAKAFCREYVQTASEGCIQETLRDVEEHGTLIADCTTGEFSSFGGEALTRQRDGSILSRDTNQVLDGSMASGESIFSEQYRALCMAP